MMKRIAIIGLGQIGGSIVLALRKNSPSYSITGIDPSLKRRRLLRSSLELSGSRWELAKDADLTILCVHYPLVADFLRHTESTTPLFDVCSGKEKLVRIANRKNLRFIGGHPMTGSEFTGEKGWNDALFKGVPFFLCPAQSSLPEDRKMVRSIVKDLGARPMIVDPAQHDRFVSLTSHFPAILARFLQRMGEEIPPEFKGPGFHSMTRLAKTAPELLDTFLQSNGKNMVNAAKQMRVLLDQWIRNGIETTDEHR